MYIPVDQLIYAYDFEEVEEYYENIEEIYKELLDIFKDNVNYKDYKSFYELLNKNKELLFKDIYYESDEDDYDFDMFNESINIKSFNEVAKIKESTETVELSDVIVFDRVCESINDLAKYEDRLLNKLNYNDFLEYLNNKGEQNNEN